VRVCSTKRGNPHDLEGEGKHSRKGQSAFQKKGDTMMQVLRDKRLVRMISMIHEVTTVNTGRKNGKTNMEIKKTYAVVQHNKFMKGIERADQCLNFYSVLWKTVKWSKKWYCIS
jgi:hypothetical protein